MEEAVEDTDAIIALGLSFGQCILSSGPFEWVRFSDEFAEEAGLAFEGITLYLLPISMIQKRLLRLEHVSIEALCNDTLTHICEQVKKGGLDRR